MASASGYNYHRFARAVLKKARKWEPSLSIQLYPTYWRFENSEINFLYDGPMKPFLLALRAQVIPAALIPFLYDIRPPVSFVDGCLVVELQDFRKTPEVRSRVVMRPAPETLPLTIDIMLERRNEDWDDNMTLELESRIMAATSAPLYLGTSILATRNAALSLALTAPAGPNMGADGTFRPTLAPGAEEDSELQNIRKLLGAGTRAGGAGAGAFQPNWSIIRVLERIKAHNKQKEAEAAARAAGLNRDATANAGPTPAPGGPGAGPPPPGPDEKKKTKKKRPAPPPEKEEETKPVKKKKATEKEEEKKEEPVKKKKDKKKDDKRDDDEEKKADPKDAKKDEAPAKGKKKPAPKKKDDDGKPEAPAKAKKKKDDDKPDDKKDKDDETPKKPAPKKKKVVKKDDKPAAA